MTGEGQLPRSYAEFGPLAPHLRYVERASRKLARSTFYGMARWQGRLERKQGFLGRIVDIGAELFAMSAVCMRAQMDAAAAAGGPRQDRRRAGRRLLRAGQAAVRRAVRPALDEHRQRGRRAGPAGHVRPVHLAGAGIVDPSIPGPLGGPGRARAVQARQRPPALGRRPGTRTSRGAVATRDVRPARGREQACSVISRFTFAAGAWSPCGGSGEPGESASSWATASRSASRSASSVTTAPRARAPGAPRPASSPRPPG